MRGHGVGHLHGNIVIARRQCHSTTGAKRIIGAELAGVDQVAAFKTTGTTAEARRVPSRARVVAETFGAAETILGRGR